MKEGIFVALEKSLKAGKYTKEVLPKPAKAEEVKEFANHCRENLKKEKIRKPENLYKIMMGMVMAKFRGRISGSEVSGLISEITGREV